MSYQLHQTEAFVLASWPRGEADRVLQLYTKDYGGVTVVAKGIRLEKSKLRGAVDLFSRFQACFIAGKEVYRLTYAELLNAHTRIRQDEARYHAAGYIMDMFRRSIADGETDAGLWQLLKDVFTLLNGDMFQNVQVPVYILSFEVQFLKQLGYLPESMPHVARAMVMAPLGSFTDALSDADIQKISMFLGPLLEYAITRRWDEALVSPARQTIEKVFGESLAER